MQENLSSRFGNNKGADPPAHPRSLISAFVNRFLESIISKLALSNMSLFYLVSVAEETGLSLEACIGVLGIRDICHFTSRGIGYFPVYFQGYGILCSISGILLFFFQNIQIQSRNTNNINKNHFKFSTEEEKLYAHDMAIPYS